MEVSVYDTVFKKEDGEMIKFDIIVPATLKDLNKIYAYGNEFLKQEGIAAKQLISADECDFCHMETASDNIVSDINKKGYFILKYWGFN
jgi:Domain of unknown function (DUF2024)